ncbi:MAG: hypothetical protein AAGU11_04625 [Syntrophobacteraceae bacterium]
MELKKLIAPDHLASGLSCQNCANLAWEYDLEEGGPGVWVCDKFPEKKESSFFPSRHDMPCFELSFWFSIFSQDLKANDDAGCEAALESFTKSLAGLGFEGAALGLHHDSGMVESQQPSM